MTYEEKKAYLRGAVMARREASDALRRLEEFRADIGIKAVTLSDMPRGGVRKHDLSDVIAALDEIEASLLASVTAYKAKAAEIEAVINREPNEENARLLRLRYLDGYTFERIAVAMGYSWRHVMRLHYRAVCELDV